MKSPWLARALVDWLVNPRLRDAIAGDLEEIFAVEAAKRPWQARITCVLRALNAGVQLRRSVVNPSSPFGDSHQGDRVMTTFLRDMGHGVRLFVKQPSYALAAVLTLALAIGANTLIFSIANVLVLKPLPIRLADQLGWIFVRSDQGQSEWRGPVSLPEYVAYRDGAPAFASLAAYQRRPHTLTIANQAERVLGHAVIGDLQTLWGLKAQTGRPLSRADEGPGVPPAVVLSHRYWVARFGGEESVVGREIRLDGQPATIVGVLTPEIELGNVSEIDLWLPFQGDPERMPRTDRTWRTMGPLVPGATLAEAHAQVAAIGVRLAAEHPDTDAGRVARVGPTRDALGSSDTWVILGMLTTVVGLLLLLACANVMNLLIARLIGRRQELAVRVAIGGTRARIVGQIVAESLVLGLTGGALGLLIAWIGLWTFRQVPSEPFLRQLTIDRNVLAFTALLALVAPLVFAILPTLRLLRRDVREALTDATLRSVGSQAVVRGQSALVVLQVTLAVSLLVVAALIAQSLRSLFTADPGFDVAPLISTQIEIPDWRAADDDDARRVRSALLEAAAALPGANAAAISNALPLLNVPATLPFDIGTARAELPRNRPTAALNVVSPGFFATIGLPLTVGRPFTVADEASEAAVAVVSQAAAARYWSPAESAVGSVITLPGARADDPLVATVIGIAADVMFPGPDPPAPHLYVLDAHRPQRTFHLMVRAAAPASLAAPLRDAVRRVDAEIPAFQLRTFAAALDEEFGSNRLLVGLFISFAVVAMLLATTGLYGVMAYAVSQRTPEIAIRLALGATGRGMAASVAASTLRLAGVGAVLGIGVALGLAQAMRSILFGVAPTDITTYVSAIAITGLAALGAAWLPMRRAMSVDPVVGLRG